jgi:hypothetical protein
MHKGQLGPAESFTTFSTESLNSLEIRNFRSFQHLQIEGLGRVNLIPLPFHSLRNSM